MKKLMLFLLPIMALLTILNFNNDNFNFWYVLDNLSKSEFVDVSNTLQEFATEFANIDSLDSINTSIKNFNDIFTGEFEWDKVGRFFSAFGDLFSEMVKFAVDFSLFLFKAIGILIKFLVGCIQNIMIVFNCLLA